ncbi:hypothetical protein D9M72_643320 [compost metagenome]
MDDADNIIDLIAPDRHSCVRARQNFAHHLLGRRIGIDGPHGCAMHHDIADFQFFQIKQTAQLVTVFLDQRFVTMQHFNRATQFFLC